MPRYKLTIEYDGSPYVGWQRQKNGYAVQEAVEKAIAAFSKQKVSLQVAGRTDTGVHAMGQIAHADLDRDWDAVRVREAINAYLVLDEERIAIVDVQRVEDDFHARFSAQARHYLYRIHNRPAPLTFDHRRAWWCKRTLDVAAMNDAADALLGSHDFTTFRAAQCQAKSPVKTLDRLEFSRDGEIVEALVSARSFLHNQVRSMVGTLKLVGEGRWTKDDVIRVRDARDHQKCGALAPPHGLYLLKVDYADGGSISP